ncbi:uncharacterized protein IUM83_17217 [Phytophthora cinnamomi]|uniref:uncharacterized protein n=1 Tax=Phytophthora cinnamomi TaxID=4785 RepID=UPI00355AB4C9|nr:hypothetical protein IUM83_17217 [Phytophthora cinnamomi]
MAHLPPRAQPAASSGSPALSSDTVVFSLTKAPSRQSTVVAGTASPSGGGFQQRETQPQLNKFRVEAPRGDGVRRMTVRVTKRGDKLGFGVRHDRYKRLQVSTLQGGDSSLRVGDTLLSVNGADLTGQEFLAVIQQLKAARPGELVFEIERPEYSASRGDAPNLQHNGQAGAQMSTRSPHGAQSPPVNPWGAASVKSVPATVTSGGGSVSASPAYWPQNGASPRGQPGRIIAGYPPTTSAPQTGVPPPSIPVTAGAPANGGQQPRKRARPAQRAVTMLDDNGQPVNVTALMADLKKERSEKAALEEKNNGLRKRLQRMLIENDEVRVRAKNEVSAAQEKAKREVTQAQNQLAAARAQLRLQDRGPDVGRTDSIVNELTACKAQLERLKKAEAERTGVLNARYRAECRIATVDAQRVLDSVVGMFRTKLRQVGRMVRDNTKYHSQEPVHHTLEQEQFSDLFGNSLCHEERAGLFYAATAPMFVVFDPSAESVVLKCQWAEQNALRDLARNFRF